MPLRPAPTDWDLALLAEWTLPACVDEIPQIPDPEFSEPAPISGTTPPEARKTLHVHANPRRTDPAEDRP